MLRPLVSVILPVYNGATTVGAAIRSIQNQTLEDWELIVIDDGSVDDTCARVLSFKDPRIRLVRNASNFGLAVSLNRGVAEASGKFFARMDADDLSFPERLSRQHAFLEANPAVDVVGSSMIILGQCSRINGVLRPPTQHDQICRQGVSGHFPLYHPTWFARAAWHQSHRYNPNYRKAQDFELLWRAASTSTYANLSEILVAYSAESITLCRRLRTRAYTLRVYTKSLRNSRWQASKGIFTVALKCAADLVLASPAGSLMRKSLPRPLQAEESALAKVLSETT